MRKLFNDTNNRIYITYSRTSKIEVIGIFPPLQHSVTLSITLDQNCPGVVGMTEFVHKRSHNLNIVQSCPNMMGATECVRKSTTLCVAVTWSHIPTNAFTTLLCARYSLYINKPMFSLWDCMRSAHEYPINLYPFFCNVPLQLQGSLKCTEPGLLLFYWFS